MPDLIRPKQIDGKLYCWDKVNKEIVEVTLVPVDLSVCGKNILAAFVEDSGNSGEDADAGSFPARS